MNAFPTPVSMNGHNKHHSDHKGMTLRDYFAAKAMPPLLAICGTRDTAAIEAYRVADAMLKARDGNS